MLKSEENELLVRVGPTTPMGNLLRRFWIPALLSEEISDRDGAPVRVTLLGETLVAFRDSKGSVGLLDAYCPHRRANLFWGRNEQCGLRCVYHGWKFDVDGNCTDLPNVPGGDKIKRAIRTPAYPTTEHSGIVWAYMGPPELRPPFPAAEVFDLPQSHRHVSKIVLRVNWFQSMEGDMDSSHVSFLHSRVDATHVLPETRISSYAFSDNAPRWLIQPTHYGFALAAQREAGADRYAWRVGQWLMPFTTLVAAPADAPFITNIRVPLDDHHTMHLRIYARLDRPLDDEDMAAVGEGVMFPEMIPGTFMTKANISNDYMIDRNDQRHGSYTGIKSIPLQDYAVTQDQGGGPIADRSRERLTASDKAIIMVRKRMLDSVRALMDGREPAEPSNAAAYRVRPIDTVLPRSEDILAFTDKYGAARSAGGLQTDVLQ